MFSKISKGQWWDFPLGLVQGCTPVSEACDHCWLLGMRNRFKQNALGDAYFNPLPLEKLKRKKPAAYAIWSDLYHPVVSHEMLSWTMGKLLDHPQHKFLILTKRIERAAEVIKETGLPLNVWIGTTVENQEWADKRLPWLLKCKTPNRFLSVEPMLGPVSIKKYAEGIAWVICGCESGPCRRETKTNWVRSLRDQCVKSKVPFFLKQIEIMGKVVKAPELDVEQWLQLPKELEALR